MRQENRSRYIVIAFIVIIFSIQSCLNDKMPVPDVESSLGPGIDKVEYVLLKPILDANNGYSFNKPADIYFGVDNFVYVADTDNNRIVMLDAGGQLQGVSNFIEHPEAISQNDSLQLLIVNKTNAVYLIDMFKYSHNIQAAPVEMVSLKADEPTFQYTGISVHNGFEYYVTVIDVADTANVRNSSFVWDFQASHLQWGPLPLNKEGSGLFTALIPTAIVSIRERWLDISSSQETSPAFIFTQQAKTSLYQNFFKVQDITTQIVEGDIELIPNTGYIGKSIYDANLISLPEDVTIDKSGFIFVVDKGNASNPGSFFRFSTSGDARQIYNGNGDNLDNIVFNQPQGIAVQPDVEDQIVYIADTGNDRVLLFKLSSDLD